MANLAMALANQPVCLWSTVAPFNLCNSFFRASQNLIYKELSKKNTFVSLKKCLLGIGTACEQQ